jgi:hypothetical protein
MTMARSRFRRDSMRGVVCIRSIHGRGP